MARHPAKKETHEMAKEKGTEETVVHDVDAEFGLENDVEDASVTTEQEEAATGEASEALEEEQVSEQADTTAKTERTWADLGVGDFEGKSNEEIARSVLQQQKDSDFRNKIYGEQASELGELRKFKAEQQAKAAAPKEEVGLFEQIPDMTEGQIADYNALYEKNPVVTPLKLGESYIRKMIAQELQAQREDVKSFVGESIEAQRDSIAFTNFLGKHEDAQQYTPFMKFLDGEQYLGAQKRPYEDLYNLAVLGKAKDPLYDSAYQLMAKHPTLSFEDAKIFAKQKAGSEEQAAEKHQKLEKELDKIDSVNSSSSTANRKSDTTRKMVTVDEEFNI